MYIPAWPSLNPAYFVKRDDRQGMPFPMQSSSNTFFYVARSGIYHLMCGLREQSKRAAGETAPFVVLAPDYHHGNEIFAMKAAGATMRYYPVRKNLDVDLDSIARLSQVEPKPRALYITHFIGWPQPMDEILTLCRDTGLLLVEDCALSFMSEFDRQPLGTFGQYSVFCLYKSLPLPNGGVLVRNGSAAEKAVALERCPALSLAGRSAELMLQWVRSRYETAGRGLFTLKRAAGRALNAGGVRRVPVGDSVRDKGFDVSSVNVGMSPVCHSLLRRFEYGRIKQIRRRNFGIMEERLRGSVKLLEKPLVDGVCPLFFPLLVKDKPEAARVLLTRDIETVEFWNDGDPEAQRPGSDAGFLRRHLLEVPIHQDVSAEAAEYAAKEILSAHVGLAA